MTFGTLFLIGLGTLILLTGSEILKKEQPATKEYFMPLFSFAIYGLAFGMLNCE